MAPAYLGRVWPSWRAAPFEQIYPARVAKECFFAKKPPQQIDIFGLFPSHVVGNLVDFQW